VNPDPSAADAAADRKALPPSAEAYADILGRIAEFGLALDLGDPESLTSLFTADGVWEYVPSHGRVPTLSYSGREQIANFAREFCADPTAPRTVIHHQSVVSFNLVDDRRAETRCALLATKRLDDGTVSIVQHGIYEDTWVRVGGRWLLSRRTLLGA
jgi:hypothetical protein